MNNKGFGISSILALIALVFLVFFSVYTFTETLLTPLLKTKYKTPNYKNEYRLYIREHNSNK